MAEKRPGKQPARRNINDELPLLPSERAHYQQVMQTLFAAQRVCRSMNDEVMRLRSQLDDARREADRYRSQLDTIKATINP